MGKFKVNLVTMKDCTDFVNAVSGIEGKITLESSNGFCVNAKSLIGALAAAEWDDMWCVYDNDSIYQYIRKWVD